MRVDDDIDFICPCCTMDHRSILEHIKNSSCPECGDPVDPSSAGYACSHVALSFRIMFSVSPELLSPKKIQCSVHCQGGRRDHVDEGWFQRMCC